MWLLGSFYVGKGMANLIAERLHVLLELGYYFILELFISLLDPYLCRVCACICACVQLGSRAQV